MELEELGLTLTYEGCDAKFTAQSIPFLDIDETEKYITGDHWQGGKKWVGWKPESMSDSARSTMFFIETAFNVNNIIGGMVKRLKGAIAGQQPDFSIVPKDKKAPEAIKNDLAEKDRALNEWFTQKDVHEEIKKFVHNRTAHGKAQLRIHVPPGLLVRDAKGFRVNASTFAEALTHIYVTAHEPKDFVDGKDLAFGEKYVITKLAGNPDPQNMGTDEFQYEITFVDKDKKTVLRTIERGKDAIVKKLDLGGYPLVIVKGDYKEAIISPSIKRQQNHVNCARTNESLAGNNINFPEVTFIDVELPEKAVLQPNGKKEMRTDLMSGMGVFRKLFSRLGSDANGGDVPIRGQMIQRQQADPEHFARIANNNTRTMHQEAGMLYIYLADSEYASGDAKIEAMSDYLILLIDNKTEIDVVGSMIGNAVTRLAMMFSGDEKYKDQFAFSYSSKLTLGRLTVEERRLMLDEVKAMLRSKRSYMVQAGISDNPDDEINSILEEFMNADDDLKQIIYGLMKKDPAAFPPKTAGA